VPVSVPIASAVEIAVGDATIVDAGVCSVAMAVRSGVSTLGSRVGGVFSGVGPLRVQANKTRLRKRGVRKVRDIPS
jgi:hypothetical protein